MSRGIKSSSRIKRVTIRRITIQINFIDDDTSRARFTNKDKEQNKNLNWLTEFLTECKPDRTWI